VTYRAAIYQCHEIQKGYVAGKQVLETDQTDCDETLWT